MLRNLLFTFFILSSLTTTAQKGKLGLSVGLGTANAINKNLNVGAGGAFGLFYNTSNTGKLLLNYTSLNNGIKNTNPKLTLRTHFVTLGYQQYFTQKKNWFVTGEVGPSFTRNKLIGAAALGVGYSIKTNFGNIDIGTKLWGASGAGTNLWLQPYVALKFRIGR